MRVLKFASIVLLVLALGVGGYISYLLFVPVTAGNVEFRLVNICRLGTNILRLNEAARIELQSLKKGSCGCLSGRLIEETGPEVAAKLTEAARRLGMFGVKRKWSASFDEKKSDGGVLARSGLKEKVLEEFSQRYVNAANTCAAAQS